MFTSLMLTAVFMTSTATMPGANPASADRPTTGSMPFAIAGPVRARQRKPANVTRAIITTPEAPSAFAYHQADGAALDD